MQIKNVIKPAMLFAAGGLASGANAAVVDIAATEAGTNIYLFNSQTAKFTFDFDLQGPGTSRPGNVKYYLRSAPSTSNVSFTNTPNNQTAFASQVELFYVDTAGQTHVNFAQAGIRVADDAGTIRYGNATYNSGTRRITDISLDGVSNFYVGTTPQQVDAAVPEPATWATAVIGLGLAGAAMRRRRRETARQPAALAA